VAAVSNSVAGAHGEDLLATSQAGPAAVRGGVLRVGGYLFGAALSVVSAALLFRHLGVRDAGRYVTVMTLVALFGGLTEAGLSSIAVRELSASADPRTSTLMRDIVGLRIALSTVAALASVAFAAAVGYSSLLIVGTALCAFGYVLQNVQVTWAAALAARLRFGWATTLELGRQAFTVAGIVVLVLAGAGLLSFLALAIPAGLAILVATAWLVRRDIPLRPRFDPAVWRRLLREVLPFAAATAVAALYFRVSLILVSLVTDERQTGLFGASFRIVEVFITIPVLIVGAALPIFSRAAASDPERLRFGIQRVVDTTTIFGAMLVLGIFVGASDIIAVVAGAQFSDASDVLQIQCLGLLGAFVSAVWGFALLSLGRYREILMITCGLLLVNVVLTLALAPAYGATGGAVATAIGEITFAVVGPFVLNRAIAPQRVSLLPIVRALLLAVPFAAFVLVGGVPPLILGGLAAGLYALAVWMLGWLPVDLVKDLRGA
jgi:O-antigen/teichoic acid export membrane protein